MHLQPGRQRNYSQLASMLERWAKAYLSHMNKNILFILLFALSCKIGFSQIGSIAKYNHLKRKNLTVLIFDSPCPNFIETKEKYGFSIKCGGTITKKLLQRQRRAIRIINKAYGINWFKNNYDKLKQ